MTFPTIPNNSRVFLDANTLIYHFTNDPTYGAASSALFLRIAQRKLEGVVSADVVSDVAHRLMTIDAMITFGWPVAGIASRIRRNRQQISQLTLHQNAVAAVERAGFATVPLEFDHVKAAANISRNYHLLSGDARIVAIMQAHGLTQLASHDSDFDAVPWLTRFSPA